MPRTLARLQLEGRIFLLTFLFIELQGGVVRSGPRTALSSLFFWAESDAAFEGFLPSIKRNDASGPQKHLGRAASLLAFVLSVTYTRRTHSLGSPCSETVKR